MKHSKSFELPVIVKTKYGSDKGKLIGYARVTGKAYYYDQRHADDKHDDDNESLFDFDIDTVMIGADNVTEAYRWSNQLSDTFADIINDACQDHAAFIFAKEVEEYWDENTTSNRPELDYTDTVQDDN